MSGGAFLTDVRAVRPVLRKIAQTTCEDRRIETDSRRHRRSESACGGYAQAKIFRVEENGPVSVDEIVETALDGPADTVLCRNERIDEANTGIRLESPRSLCVRRSQRRRHSRHFAPARRLRLPSGLHMPGEDSLSVVDSALRVRGLNGLRVAES